MKKQKLLVVLLITVVSTGILKSNIVLSQTTGHTVLPPHTTQILPYDCPLFLYTLYRGITDANTNGEVSRLQRLLAEDPTVYPEGLITGYYGSMTEKAVQRLQAKQGIVSFGDAFETGYGVFGPQTQARVVIIFCPPYNSDNLPPTINGVSGPSTLSVGEVGEWKIKAFDPENDSLSYSVTWGDEVYSIGSNTDQELFAPSPIRQNATFTHAYSRAGVYSPTFIVTDSNGLSTKTSISVNVGGIENRNISPVINVAPIILSPVKVGQSVSFGWYATDENRDNLSWSISWGNGNSDQGSCQFPNQQNKQGWSFNASHTWREAGTYIVKATVNDCRGGSDSHTFRVVVNK